jgi:hypothetical protein
MHSKEIKLINIISKYRNFVREIEREKRGREKEGEIEGKDGK